MIRVVLLLAAGVVAGWMLCDHHHHRAAVTVQSTVRDIGCASGISDCLPDAGEPHGRR